MNDGIVRWWMLNCPTTGKQAPSGYMGTERALATFEGGANRECPLCGQVHAYTKDLYSLGDPVAD